MNKRKFVLQGARRTDTALAHQQLANDNNNLLSQIRALQARINGNSAKMGVLVRELEATYEVNEVQNESTGSL